MSHKFSSILRHTTHVTTIIFISGFIFDMIVLPDISHAITRYIGLGHITVVAVLIVFREWLVSRNRATMFEQRVYSFASFWIAFSSGAALSFLSVYSIRSAEFSVSWPLFILLFICIVINEVVTSHSFRFNLDVGVLITAVLFFVIFNVPILVKVQNDSIFLLSVAVAFLISFIYLYFLKFSSETARNESHRSYALAIGIPMFVVMLYFLNVIPAVPLSLKDSGVYHKIVRTSDGEYIGDREIDTKNLSFFRKPTYHLSSIDTGVYFFSAVNYEGEITAPLSHVWEKYDETKHMWVMYDKPISFTLESGRRDGYRAYSVKQNISEGLWRVTVKVDSKRVVGRQKFWVVYDSPKPLEEVKL